MRRAFLVLLHSILATPLAAQLPPDARWRTIDTPHFRINFEERLESLARRTADRAERAYAILSEELVEPPANRIEMVVADNVDFANGYATPFPTNRVVIYAHPPIDNPELSYYEDWLQLLVLHELVHVFHLDTSRGIWSRLRSVMGRNPLLFPAAYSPGWVTEGLATYLESRLTGAGRVRGTLHEMALRTAILQGAFFPIDRASGTGTIWPGPAARYVYGSLFIEHLARTFGPEKIPAFVEAYAGKTVPYTVDRVARSVIDASFTRAWRDWSAQLATRYGAVEDSLRRAGLTEPEILTGAGRIASFPRYASTGVLAYSAATGLEQPAIRSIGAGGVETTIQGRTSTGPFSWTPGGEAIVYDQLEYAGPHRIFSDLRRTTLAGEDRRLTRSARLAEPDLDHTGRRVVAVADAGETNSLVIRDLVTGSTRQLTAPARDVHWSLPRWSPGGDRIAVSRWTSGGFHDVVLLDSAGGMSLELTRDRAVDSSPSWSPDGRFVVFSSDRTGIPNLFAYDLAEKRLLQVTNVLTGAFSPSVSPDGRWVAFSYYQADGYHVARAPFLPARFVPAPPLRAEAARAVAPVALDGGDGGPVRDYSPWPSVRPATWLPLVEEGGSALGAGAGIAILGQDAVERHVWDAELVAFAENLRVEGAAAYRYRGLGNPIVDLSASQRWDVALGAGTLDAEGKPLGSALLSRRREVGGSLLWLRRRWNSSAWIGSGLEVADLDRSWDEPDAARGRTIRQRPLDLAAVAQLGYSSARGYGISLGPQEGLSASGRLEGHRHTRPLQGEEAVRGYLRATGRGRSYHALELPGFARHVLGFRLDVAGEHGSRSPGISVGGSNGGSLGTALNLPVGLGTGGGGAAFPIRGYPEGVQWGNRAVTGSVEYRFPLRRVERGYRLWPVFLERVWGDLFVDAGTAWCVGPCERTFTAVALDPHPLPAVGAELNVDLQLGYLADLPLRFGAAVPLHEPRAHTPRWYVTVGRAF